MKVTECRTPGDLPAHEFSLLIFEGRPEAIPAFDAPKLVLFGTPSLETRPADPDAVLPSPLASRLLRRKLSELLGNAEAHSPPPIPQPAATQSLEPLSSSCRVLLTDDNVVNQKIAAALLSRMGCQVDIADSGFSALQQVNQKQYDVVFMDCVMPEMDGFETTAAIRSLAGKLGRVPIVALTASATTEDRDKCLAAGMDDFLTKPIRVERLRECLAQWTGKK
jgi:CheY-like chemotaxis protein